MSNYFCECSDPECPHCRGDCYKKGTVLLLRSDMDSTSILFCCKCAEDALDSGLFYTPDQPIVDEDTDDDT